MRHFIRLFVLALVTTSAVLVGQSAPAAVVLDDYRVLPVPSASQLMSLPQADQFAIGSWTGEVTIVDRTTGAMSTVPGSTGTGRLTTDITGDRLYGVTRQGGTVTEVDTGSLTARSWSVEGCPLDAVARQGVIFYVESGGPWCGLWTRVMRLDPATGASEPIEVFEDGRTFFEPTLVPVPGEDTFLIVESGSSAYTRVIDVGPDGSASLGATRGVGGKAFMTDEGDAVVIGRGLYTPGLEVIDPDLGLPNMTQVSSSVITSADQDWPRARVNRRSDGGLVNAYSNPVESEGDPRFVDARVDQGTLTLIANTNGGTARLYTDDSATVPAPEVTISAAAPHTTTESNPVYSGDHISLTGTVTREGAPVVGAAVTLSLLHTDDPEFASVTTDDSGTWSYDFVPERPGQHVVKASHVSDGRESSDSDFFYVAKTPSTITMTGPDSVEPRTPVTMQGRLHSDGESLGGRTVTWQPYCATTGYPVDPDAYDVVTADDGTFSMTHIPRVNEACGEYEFYTVWPGDSMYAEARESHRVPVSWRHSDLTLEAPSSAYVQDEVAATITLRIEGEPASGQPVEVSIRRGYGDATRHDGVTDADGKLRVPFTVGAEGTYTVTATLASTSDTLGDSATASVAVSQVPSTVTLESAPAAVEVGDPVTIKARLQRGDGRNGGVQLQLITSDADGTRRDHFATTDSDGSAEFIDVPSTAGTTRYWVRYNGDCYPCARYLPAPDQRFSVTVDRHSPTVALSTDQATYRAGQTATINVNVTGSETRHIVVAAYREGIDPVVLFDGVVPDEGLVLTRTMRRSETITARHPDDARHQANEVSLWREVQLGQETTAIRPIDRVGRYAVYRRGSDPTFVTRTLPRRVGICIHMELQKYAMSGWRTLETSSCGIADESGKVRWTLADRQPAAGARLRTRGVFSGDGVNAASKGGWAYFRFR
jgi:hypothetical protein